jgi:azurin
MDIAPPPCLLRSLFPMKPFLRLVGLSAIAAAVHADPAPAPVRVTLKTKPAKMSYDREKIEAAPGAEVTIILQNDDDLPHNLVVCKPKADGTNDKGLDVAMAAWNLGEAGMKQNWLPTHDRILAHTAMVAPHESQTLTFTAPEQEGLYPYVCTFPGHATVMNGTLSIHPPLSPIKNLHYRYYTGDGLTKLPDLGALQSVEEGQLPSGKVDVMLHFKDRPKNFALEFEGALDCPKDGDYQIALGSDDGSRLWIDGKELLHLEGIHRLSIKEKKVRLTKGEHPIRIHYFQAAGEAELYLAWSGPGFNDAVLSVFDPEANPGKGKGKKNKEETEGLPLVVTNEARIYRNFIAGSSPRGIAVGYPGGGNICWDADQMNLALVWQGAFIDAKRHWTNRGAGDQPPLGVGVAKLGQQRALGVLASQTDPWVPAYQKEQMRDSDYTFRGYELDAQRRPTFKYEYRGVTVTEFFEQSGDFRKEDLAIKRSVTLQSKAPPPNLYFLALAGPIEPKGKAFIHDKTVKVTLANGEPIVRQNGAATEVLLPVTFKDGKAQFIMSYSWNLK